MSGHACGGSFAQPEIAINLFDCDGRYACSMPQALRNLRPHHRNALMISLADLQRRIDAGDLSADAAIAQSLEATRAHEKSIGAFVCRDKTPARKAPGRCAASRSASRTSWTPRISRPRWARRSTGAIGRAAMRPS